MHIPDGFINPALSAAAGITAASGFGVALSRARKYLTERLVPLAALVAAFVFAAQMVNFPVVPGMSGHLMGAVLAAVLVGPAVGYVIISIVLAVQALLFADGGISALGLNIVNVALVAGVGGYYVYRFVLVTLRSRVDRIPLAAGVAGFMSVLMAAGAFVVEFWLGGTAESVSGEGVAVAMLSTHALIGIGEGVITALVVAAVMRTRSDLVYGAPTYGGRRRQEQVS